MADDLTARIRDLAERAAGSSRNLETKQALTEVIERLDGPVRLAVSGRLKAGKSTLLNALIGENLAPTDAGECTRIVTWYHYSDRPFARLHPIAGPAVETRYLRGSAALDVDLRGLGADAIGHLEIGWPSRRLDGMVLIDTPGIASISAEVSARTHEVLSAEEGRVPVADAVLYLLRHTHSADLRFLESFHDDELARGTPVNTVGVLSRADEIGSARLDAMDVAARVATRYQTDRRLHRLCPVVVPVNGLLGHAAATLREDEYATVAAIAAAPQAEVGELLLTADRLAVGPSPLVPVGERARLLDRLGLYGVRLSVELVRSGAVANSSELAGRLADVCGLERLREVVDRQFGARARILKARSAVAALHELLGTGECDDGPELLRRLEQITAGAHDFEEVRILLESRAGGLGLEPARTAELDLLMGGSGHDSRTRLGIAEDASGDDVTQAAGAALEGWRGVERHPLSGRATQRAARAATRTLEGLLADSE